MNLDPINDIENSEEDETLFACACGDPECIGHNDDPANINLCGVWYAADCVMAKDHPLVVEGREQEQRDAERIGK